jgi:hypothetical protein
MSSALQAEVLSIREIFGSTADLRVPPYQRGFAWEDAETSALLADLLEAFETDTIYFLGAIVVIHPKARGPSDVVDGQQRLTTLTIMLAVLRDLAPEDSDAADLHAMIGHEALIWGERRRWRVTLNHLDTAFFRAHVQKRGATLNLDEAEAAAASESQLRIASAVRAIHDELREMASEERIRFARWLAHNVSLARVRVGEHNLGYKVFLVLNQRGKPLSDHDILKSALFEQAGFSDEEAITNSSRWNEFSGRLGSVAFEGMLKQIRFLYDRSMKGEFIDGLMKSVTARMPVSRFINEVLPRFVDAYDTVSTGAVHDIDPGPDALRSLCFLRSIHHESWRAPAIKFLIEGPSDPEISARFFSRLERLAYMMQYSIKERDYRHKRYRRLMDAMDTPGAIFASGSPLDLTREEEFRFLERLRGRFPNFKQRRALVMRLNAAVPGGAALAPESDATLEHIFPRTLPKTSVWLKHWTSSEDIAELTECLGNFTLLPDAVNQAADRADFDAKKSLYFPDGGPAAFALSEDLRDVAAWTPETARLRRDLMVAHLARAWDLAPAERQDGRAGD